MKDYAKVTFRCNMPFSVRLGTVFEDGEHMEGTVKAYTIEDDKMPIHKAVFWFDDMGVMLDIGDLLTLCMQSDLWKKVTECAE